jgi:hypothetical protein
MRLRKQRGGALKDQIRNEVMHADNFEEVRDFLQAMEAPQIHAGFPRGPYAGNKYVYAVLSGIDDQEANAWAAAQPPDAEGHPIVYEEDNYNHPHKIIVIEMKIEGQNVSEVAITLHPNKKPNSLDADYPPGHMPGSNEYVLADGANPISNAIEAGLQEIQDAVVAPAGGAGV